MAKSVILVDDDKLVLDAQFRLLSRRQPSWQLRSATDGNEALQKLEQMPAQVAVIDMCMPQMDGMELARRLRQRWPDMLVIMLTGHADLSTVISAINQGSIFKFHEKPCAIETLIASIDEAFARKEGSQQEGAAPANHDLVMASAANDLPIAFLAVDQSGRFLRASERAKGWLRSDHFLYVDGGGILRARDHSSSCELAAAIKLAANDGAVRAIRLSHIGEGRPVTAAISPSRTKDGSIVGAVITLVDSTKAPTPDAHALSDLFGLTPAEAKLSSALAMGQSLERASAGLQITVSSARTYLKAIFQKTGASRQAELVHVILNSAAAFLPASI